MDLRMPGVDGIEATVQIKAREPKTQVVILTAHSSGDTRDLAEFMGAADLIEKNAPLEKIVSRAARGRVRLPHVRLARSEGDRDQVATTSSSGRLASSFVRAARPEQRLDVARSIHDHRSFPSLPVIVRRSVRDPSRITSAGALSRTTASKRS